jgi:hypothetical protein
LFGTAVMGDGADLIVLLLVLAVVSDGFFCNISTIVDPPVGVVVFAVVVVVAGLVLFFSNASIFSNIESLFSLLPLPSLELLLLVLDGDGVFVVVVFVLTVVLAPLLFLLFSNASIFSNIDEGLFPPLPELLLLLLLLGGVLFLFASSCLILSITDNDEDADVVDGLLGDAILWVLLMLLITGINMLAI